MARDHAMAEAVGPGCAALRLYRWTAPTISFGRNEPARGLYDVDTARRQGIVFVRRPTGGRAVLHHHELTYAVAVPATAYGGVRTTYQRVNRALLRGLWALGVPATLWDDRRPAARPDAGPCFDRPAHGEVVVGASKIVGSAQARVERVVLQHGSLPLRRRTAWLRRLSLAAQEARGPSGPARGEPETGQTTVSDVLGFVPRWDRVAEAVEQGFRAEFAGRWEDGAHGCARVERESEERWRSRYGHAEWTWRR